MPAQGLQYLHGVETVEVDDGMNAFQTVKSAIIGVIGTAPNRKIEDFPINQPFLIAGDPASVVNLGSEGTLCDALDSIFRVARPTVVAVVIEEGDTNLETYANIVGNVAARTGVHAFRKASSILKLVPKLLIAPGYTGVMPSDGVASVAVGTGGSGYVVDKTTCSFTAAPAGGITAEGKVIVNGSGAVQAIVITKPGRGYEEAPTITITGDGTGAIATATLGTVANPAVVEMLALAPYLRAMVIADGPSTTYADAVAYAAKFDSERLIMIDGGVQVFDPVAAANVIRPAAPFAAALQAQVDENEGFWFSFSNRPIPGVVGVGRPIDWSFTDSNVEGQLLNAIGITVVVQDSGFRFMGVRSVTTRPGWKFYSVRRTADMVYETVEQGVRTAIDKPISIGLLSWLESSVNAYLRQLIHRGALLGGVSYLDKNQNAAADLVSGHVTMDYDLEPPAPMERLTFRAHRNAGYYDDLINQFLTQNALAA